MVKLGLFPQSESFGLYALYSKNKPQSDALILHRRHDIFKVSLCVPSFSYIPFTLCFQYTSSIYLRNSHFRTLYLYT